MTTARSTHRALIARKATPGFLAEIADLFRNLTRDLTRSLADPYRPELHYMRGPGPKWHAKHAPAVAPSTASLGAMPIPALLPVRVRR